ARTASATRAAAPAPGKATATAASGASAALSIRPSMTSERPIARRPAGQPGASRRRLGRPAGPQPDHAANLSNAFERFGSWYAIVEPAPLAGRPDLAPA